ncbi:MAG: hemolysin III family protein [Acidimicrobiales bacterium]
MEPAVDPGVDADRTTLAELLERPRLRGRLHQVAAILSFGGLIWLVRSAETGPALAAAWIYGLACIALYLTSSSYHVFSRSPKARRVMQRLDHSMIYVLIAGTFTPLCILGMDGWWRWALLAVVWMGAIAGVVIKAVALERFTKLGFALYLVLGWVGLTALPALWAEPRLLLLILGGGVLYTVGAVLFALHKPRLSPTWFGYHELWHVFGIAAGALFFAANLSLVAASGAPS